MLSFFVSLSLAFLASKNESLAGLIGEAEQFFKIFSRSFLEVSREEVRSGLSIEKRCCPFFIATKVVCKCPTGES